MEYILAPLIYSLLLTPAIFITSLIKAMDKSLDQEKRTKHMKYSSTAFTLIVWTFVLMIMSL